MSLSAKLPGFELYSAIFTAFRGMDLRDRHNVPVIFDGPILIQGENKAWEGSDAIVVVSEATDEFCVITDNVTVMHAGALYYLESRNIFRYLQTKKLLDVEITINNEGIFKECDRPACQLTLNGPGFNEFVDLGIELSLLADARKITLEKRIAEIDRKHRIAPSVIKTLDVKRYERDESLVYLLKELRGSKCQICGYTFKKPNGDYYSECHHLESLANSGLDVSKNMLVVCANCHKQLHYGQILIVEHDDLHVVINIDGVSHDCRL